LNGNREVGLVLNTNGLTKGSHVNFTCNPFFELIGPERTFCIGRNWESEVPQCRLSFICKERPPMVVDNAILISSTRVEFKVEVSYSNFEKRTAHTQAAYVCTPGTRFNTNTNMGYRVISGINMAYKNVSCVGNDKWGELPVCL
jgi:hypothetical protein